MFGISKTLLICVYFLCFCQNLVGVWALKCKCDICKDTNYTCETDGYCFTSTYLKDGVVKYSYSYLDQAKFLPLEEPIWCHSKPTATEAHICCQESDFCNVQEKNQPHLLILNNLTSTGNCVIPPTQFTLFSNN